MFQPRQRCRNLLERYFPTAKWIIIFHIFPSMQNLGEWQQNVTDMLQFVTPCLNSTFCDIILVGIVMP